MYMMVHRGTVATMDARPMSGDYYEWQINIESSVDSYNGKLHEAHWRWEVKDGE